MSVSPPVHDAALGFEETAGIYEAARPAYPPAAVDQLVAELGIGPGRLVVDVAAGTGKLTRQLLPTGARVVAVEPLAAMRAELGRAVPGLAVAGGVAEALPLRAAGADAVVVAQAFHWFDGPAALAEIHRVLRPGGRLGLAWNVRDRDIGWVRALAQLTERHAPEMPRYRTGAWRRAFEATALFGPLAGARHPHEHEVDADTMVGRVASISWISVLPPAEREATLSAVRRLFDGMPARFPVPYHTEIHWCRARPA